MKQNRHKGSYILLFLLYGISRVGKSIEQKQISGCLGMGEVVVRNDRLKRTGCSSRVIKKKKKVWKLERSDHLHHTVNALSATELFIL